MIKVLILITGGAIGSALRYGVSMWVQRSLQYSFPFGILSVNIIGSFLIGFCWSLAENYNFSANTRAFLFTGLFGGFTTFSSFAQEVENMKAANAEELEALRIKYLSKKGEISALMNDFRNVAADQKREVGKFLNELKEATQNKINELKEGFDNVQTGNDDIDLTRTSYPIELGTRHPLSIVKKEICDIFGRLGFSIAEGPEIEDDWHVFSSLNFAEDHPARDMQDTFFIQHNPDVLLRTHTSSVQTRVMETQEPPIRIICPGRVYRNEAISYRAHCFFHQVEALYVDKNVSFADLKQALLFFAKEMFGPETKIRLRPSYFPFTEPSAEMDISCNLCGGKGCAFCKHTGWVEILGCGMVDPNVLENCGIDSKVYTGYALGMGIERITNLKYQVKDLRMFSENDVRFLKQFESAN